MDTSGLDVFEENEICKVGTGDYLSGSPNGMAREAKAPDQRPAMAEPVCTWLALAVLLLCSDRT